MTDDEYDNGEHRKLMFAHFGAAIYLANCFEHGLANALMCADFLTKQYAQVKKTGLKNFDRSKYEAEFDAFFDQQFSQTMGSLLKRLEAAVPLDTNLKSKIALAKERRNFLAHHFYRERVEKMFTPMGLDEMIDELEGDQKLFRMVDQELEEVTSSIRKRLGIRDEWVETEFRKMVNELKGAASR